MNNGGYRVQCSSGNPNHVWQTRAGSQLHAICSDWHQQGNFTPFIIPEADCPECIADKHLGYQEFADQCKTDGCGFLNATRPPCKQECRAIQALKRIAESPYVGQLEDITPSEAIELHNVSLNGQPLFA